MIHRILLFALLVSSALTGVRAESFLSTLEYDGILGYSLGGTAPVGLPASIRRLNSYMPTPSFRLGVLATRPLTERWGVTSGIIVEDKGMKTDARVANYHMKMVRGGEELEGRFWGDVETDVTQWMITVPLQAALRTGNFRFRFGPYASFLFHRRFTGFAHDGYLRVGDPTGARMIIGDDSETQGSYNFSSDMRRLQWGIEAGADWFFRHRLGLSADLSWGLSGVHRSSFTTIEQTLYPIYGSLSFIYRIH